jgi:glutathione S-transferase
VLRGGIRLYTSNTTPFGRKVLMLAHEIGLADRLSIEIVADTASEALGRVNPLNKIPALALDDGTTLFDSRVICEYLDSLHGARLHPIEGPERWRALRLQALADGICDAAVLRLLESRRPPAFQWPDWVAKQRRKVTQGLDELERETLVHTPDIGTLAVLVALGYLDFRFAEDAWRTGRPRLASWFAAASDRDSFRATAPPA